MAVEKRQLWLERSISLLAGFHEKENSLETSIVMLEIFLQRVFSDWIWRISKFQFRRRILDNYRQPLLKSFGNFFRTIYRTIWNARPVYPSFQVFLNATSFRCTWNFERFTWRHGGHVWCFKTMKRRPCWCIKKILWELNSFLM